MTEPEYWRTLISDLQQQITVAEISEFVRAKPRAVWFWKAGSACPSGLPALRLYLLHVKLCTDKQRDLSQIA